MKYEALQLPIKIGKMELKNRFAVPAMDTKYIGTNGEVTDQLIDYWATRAKGGFGLLITECTAVHPMGISGHVLQIWDDKYILGLKKLTDEVHLYGSKIAVQLYHCGRQTVSALIGGKQPLAPSAIPCTMNKSLPRELETNEVYEIIEQFGDAALRSYKAGFDAVEIHGGHGYIVSEFMSAYYNKRIDEFGGNFEARMRFPVEIIKNIKKKVGADYPIIFRLSTDEMSPGGRTIDESRAVARVLEEAGVDSIDASVANYYSFEYNVAPSSVPQGFNLKNAAEIKKSVSIPVIGVGRITSPYMGEDALLTGKADIIGFGRGSLADPYLPNKVVAGDAEHIAPCSGCMEGCIGHIFNPDPEVKVSCAINPFTGREEELKITPAVKKKKVVIVGGGPAGLEAAWVAAKRGHNVKLYEKDKHLGGQYRIAAIPPFKQGIAGQLSYLIWMAKKYQVDIKMNCEFNAETLQEEKPDVVILATGGVPFVPPVKNLDKINLTQANDILDGKVQAGKNVLIIGGGLVGAETADFLGEHGHNVTIMDMLPEIAQNMVPSVKIFLLKRLNQYGVKIITSSTVKEFLSDGIIYEKDGEAKKLQGFDSIVIALGSKANNPLEECIKEKIDEVYVIGDAKKVRLVIDAVEEGARVALKL